MYTSKINIIKYAEILFLFWDFATFNEWTV